MNSLPEEGDENYRYPIFPFLSEREYGHPIATCAYAMVCAQKSAIAFACAHACS